MNTVDCKINHCQLRASGLSGTGLILYSPLLWMKFGLADYSFFAT